MLEREYTISEKSSLQAVPKEIFKFKNFLPFFIGIKNHFSPDETHLRGPGLLRQSPTIEKSLKKGFGDGVISLP